MVFLYACSLTAWLKFHLSLRKNIFRLSWIITCSLNGDVVWKKKNKTCFAEACFSPDVNNGVAGPEKAVSVVASWQQTANMSAVLPRSLDSPGGNTCWASSFYLEKSQTGERLDNERTVCRGFKASSYQRLSISAPGFNPPLPKNIYPLNHGHGLIRFKSVWSHICCC